MQLSSKLTDLCIRGLRGRAESEVTEQSNFLDENGVFAAAKVDLYPSDKHASIRPVSLPSYAISVGNDTVPKVWRDVGKQGERGEERNSSDPW